MQFEIDKKTKQELVRAVLDADAKASTGTRVVVALTLAQLNYSESRVFTLDERRDVDAEIMKNIKVGSIFYRGSGLVPAIAIYAPRPYDINVAVEKTYPNALDYKDPLSRYSKEYRDLVEQYKAEHQPPHVVDLLTAAFKPHTVVFTK